MKFWIFIFAQIFAQSGNEYQTRLEDELINMAEILNLLIWVTKFSNTSKIFKFSNF